MENILDQIAQVSKLVNYEIKEYSIKKFLELFFNKKPSGLMVEDKSTLIEALIMRYNISPIIMEDGYESQNLISTFAEFINNEFELTGLRYLTSLNGLNFDALPTTIQFLILYRKLTVVVYASSPTLNPYAKLLL